MKKGKRGGFFTEVKKDHKKVKDLFRKLNQAKTLEQCRTLYRQLREQIIVHAQVEETLLYPQLKEKPKLRELGFYSNEEHGVVKYLLQHLDSLNEESEEFEAGLSVLEETITHHVREEEGMLFKKMRSAFTPLELREMAESYLTAKKEMMEQPKKLVA